MTIDWRAHYVGYRQNFLIQMSMGFHVRQMSGPYPLVNSKRNAFYFLDATDQWVKALKECFPSADINDCWVHLSDADYAMIRLVADYPDGGWR